MEESSHKNEHVLACIQSTHRGDGVILAAARLANAVNGGFTVVFLEAAEPSVISEKSKLRYKKNMMLAQQLGGATETVYTEDAVLQVAKFARLLGVSRIIAGSSGARRKIPFIKPCFTEGLTAAVPELDVYTVEEKAEGRDKAPKSKGSAFCVNMREVLKSVSVLLLSTAVGFAFSRFGFSEANIITVYILGVLTTAVITEHRIYSLVLSAVSVLTFNFFFTVPRFTLEAYGSGYPVTFFIMFLSAFLTGSLATKIKQHAQQAAQTAHRTKILLDTNQLLQKAGSKGEVAEVMANRLTSLLYKNVIFYHADGGELNDPILYSVNSNKVDRGRILETERAAAVWTLKNNKMSGATTSNHSGATCLYFAVSVNKRVYGVVGIENPDSPVDNFERSIVLSILGDCALALQNLQAVKERQEAAVLAKNEQLRANLLRSISHDLRTPLTSISGNAGILLKSGDAIEREKRKTLYGNIYDESLWLINLVENLLSVTRIEEGSMKLNKSGELLEEVVDEALKHVGRRADRHKINVQGAEEYVMANMDARLIVQVIINLVDNALKYTDEGSSISISIKRQGDFAIVDVADNGGGIDDDVKNRVFDMFYTGENTVSDSRRSLGLGLALCKSIINAHGGVITVRDNVPKGAVFSFTLPIKEVRLNV